LKDKTTFNTPTDIVSNNDGQQNKVIFAGDNTVSPTLDGDHTSNNISDVLIGGSRGTNSKVSYDDVSEGNKYKIEDIKITDESKNKSVSDATGDEEKELRRASFISTKSKTNSFIESKIP
jgi:hypothetical protein